MRVLHVVPSLTMDAGGPARSVRQLVSAQRERGVDAWVAAHGADGEGAIAISHMAGPGEVPTPASAAALSRAIGDADLVEIHSLWNGTVSMAAALCRRLGAPYVLAPRGMLDPACLARRRLLKRLYAAAIERRTLTGASGFHFLSEEERRAAVVGRPLTDEEVAVSPNGAPLPSAELPAGVLRSRYPMTHGRRVVLYLGRLDPIKGIDLQIEALAHLAEADRPLLLIVGPDYGDRDRLQALARVRRVEPWIVWSEPVYGLERLSLLAEADLVLLTSTYDANPVIVVETLAVGGVLLATAGCGGVEAAAARGAAVVVRRSADDLSRAMRSLLGDREARARVRRSAVPYARDVLDRRRVLDPLVALYERLTRSAAGRRTA